MLLLAEYVSAKPWPDPCQPHAVARRVHPAKSVPDLRQPHDVARRVRLGQTVARSMSAACCCSQSTSRPNRCPIYVSRMMLFAECISAKPLPDLRQPHDVARRVRLGQTVARSMSAACCCSQSTSRPNRCPIYVSRIVSLAVLSDPRQPHSVARSVVRSMSAA